MTKKTPAKVRRLFGDIEVTHNVVLAFRAGYDQHINPESIIQERKIICIAYKWEGEKKVTVLRWKNQDDKELIKDFLKVAEEADEIVGYNGDRYDWPFIRTRCLAHNLPPIPNWKTVDPCAWAKKYFAFNSNKLNYVAKFLGFGEKMKTDYTLWHSILIDRCEKALDKMCKYCGMDVILLEKVYHKLKFCVKPKSHAGVAGGLDKWTCPRDGSINVHLSKTKISAVGTKTFQFQCQDCGGYYTISQTAFDQYQKFLKDKNKKK